MENNQEILKNAQTHFLTVLFSFDILQGNLNEINELYKASGITPQMLINQNHMQKTITGPDKQIYADIMHELIPKIISDPTLAHLFFTLYNTRYPHIIDAVAEIGKAFSLSASEGEDVFLKYINKIKNTLSECFFFILSVINDPVVSVKDSFRPLLKYIIHNAGFLDANDLQCKGREECEDNYYIFTDETEQNTGNIFQSKHFERYVNRQRQRIADSLRIPIMDLKDHFQNNIHERFSTSSFCEIGEFDPSSIVSATNFSVNHILQKDYVTDIFELLINDLREKQRLPDPDNVIMGYYKGVVKNIYLRKIAADEEFTRYTLSRECFTTDTKNDYVSIYNLYIIACMKEMYDIMQDKYYEHFSLNNKEKTANPLYELQRRYDDLLIANSKLEDQISAFSDKYSSLEDKRIKDVHNAWLAKDTEHEKTKKELSECKANIQELNDQLIYQKNYICYLEDALSREMRKPTPVEDGNEVSFLYSKRFLFVGHDLDSRFNGNLHNRFPKSIFMGTETKNISKVKVDAVVFFLSTMSHAQAYKVLNKNHLKNVPIIYCKGKSYKTVLSEMAAFYN